jgi:radical SAM superfamily enzyme YgiQ (UPF0313 family)
MKRILFVTHDGVSQEPLGMEYVSSALLRAGHATLACTESQALLTSANWGADFVAFQVLSGDEGRWGAVAAGVKELWPRRKTIFGGPHYLFFSKAGQEHADIIIRGDGERATIDAVNGRSHVDLEPIVNLDALAPPDRELFYNVRFPHVRNNLIRNFLAARGCPYKCTYCYNSNKEWQDMTKGARVRQHSPEYMVEDIERTLRLWGGKFVAFQDDIFGIDMQWLERFTDLYSKYRFPFFAQLRPKLITEDRVKLLKQAGIHIASFAIESGNEETRKEVLDRRESNELIEKGVALLHKYKIKFRMQNLLGLPVDDPLADAMETLRFNIKCKPTLSWCSLLQAYPGTVMADILVKKGVVKSVEELTYLVNATFFDECSVPNLRDKEKIERLHKYWSAVVRWPWLYPVVTKGLIHLNLGRRIQNAFFDMSKKYINAREYWRVNLGDHLSKVNKFQQHDRLGGELVRR